MEELLKAEFVTLHHRREFAHAPMAIKELLQLGIRETVHVSELLEVPTLVASTDLVGIFAASMGSIMEQRLGLQVLPLPLGSPSLPIYMIWHETRRHDPAHRWLREAVAQELSRFAPG
jgi:DNA-binding transcriptional LysR family regulator